MARRPTGQLYVNRSKTTGEITSFGVRFRYAGKRRYVTLDVTTEKEAEAAMAHLMADVQRGLWTPPEERQPEPQPREAPTFYEFASAWLEAQRTEGGRDGRGLSEKGDVDLCWRLNKHLLPHFARLRLDEITVERVDAYRRAKVAEGILSPGSVNKMLTTLAAILEVAVEYEHIERNPAKGKRRRLRVARPRRTYLDRAEQIDALLTAAGALDAAGRTAPWRRALLAVLVFAGPRIGEALELRWRDVDLANGRLRIRGTKTDAAERTVELLPILRDELATYAAGRRERGPDERVFTSSRGGRVSESNVRNRALGPAVEKANVVLATRQAEPIPDGLTPHSLRRTFASLLVALGRDPAVVMRQMGHTTPHMTLGVYTQAMDWSDGERAALRALVEGETLLPEQRRTPASA